MITKHLRIQKIFRIYVCIKLEGRPIFQAVNSVALAILAGRIQRHKKIHILCQLENSL